MGKGKLKGWSFLQFPKSMWSLILLVTSELILESSCGLSFVSFLIWLFSGPEKNLYFLVPSRQISLKIHSPHNCYKEQWHKSQKMKPVTAGKGGGS